jgi:hypothetical protein
MGYGKRGIKKLSIDFIVSMRRKGFYDGKNGCK